MSIGSRSQVQSPQVLKNLLASNSGASLVTGLLGITGAASRNLNDKIADIVHVKDFGVTTADSNQSTAMQNAFNAVRDDGISLIADPVSYRCDDPLTLLSTSTTGQNYDINFRGGIIDQSNLELSEIGLHIGATSQANAHDKESICLSNITFIGPESNNPYSGGMEPDTSTNGLFLEYCLNTYLNNVQVRRFYEGMKTNFCFPLVTSRLLLRENYHDYVIERDSTLSLHLLPEFVECRFGIIGDAGTGNITNQIFFSPRFESLVVGGILDPGNTTGVIEGVKLLDCYVESLDRDFLREGIAFDSDATVRGADRTQSVYSTEVTSALVSGFEWNATRSPFVWGTNGNAKGGKYDFQGSFVEGDCVNRPTKFYYNNKMDRFIGDGTNIDTPLVPGFGICQFTGGGVTNYKAGNIDTITRNSAGQYTITFHENYVSVGRICVSSAADNGTVEVDYSASSASQIVIKAFDKSASPVQNDIDTISLTINGPLD